jgi:hypothetical protein
MNQITLNPCYSKLQHYTKNKHKFLFYSVVDEELSKGQYNSLVI